jgi:hypothetical protein
MSRNASLCVGLDTRPGPAGSNPDGCGARPPAPTEPSPTSPFGDAMWTVRTGIAAGPWMAPGGRSYWERLNGFGGTFSNIIDNDFGPRNRVVVISLGDAGFSTDSYGTWTKGRLKVSVGDRSPANLPSAGPAGNLLTRELRTVLGLCRDTSFTGLMPVPPSYLARGAVRFGSSRCQRTLDTPPQTANSSTKRPGVQSPVRHSGR